ncbi:uncharacterized protein E0L32_009582 [Thyridium curvatum]|uniref:DNA-directed RNA polymerases I and III subunit RPAC2 n=1 Tax=Thyridium curvatum TaxID=1093900 RepID=A0A507AMS2_9PEZI|nr:uncharacterized protein E0L32_009582 [Thyridium curvatum]TPX09003.1 hypothetical protein E0L32_009582 [Thyridium curvatum]
MPTRSKARKEEPQEAVAAAADVAMEDVPTSAQPDEGEDVDVDADEADEDEDQEEPEAQRVKLLPGSTATAASFEFLDEGHTLGNALRYIIMKNPDVEFCAYAIPHPSEPKMNVRIQTYEGTTAIQALEKGLRDLQDLCDVVADKYAVSREEFTNEMQA